MTDKDKQRAKELAEAHWRYVGELLESFGIPESQVDAAAFVYISAFEHGYKHAMEDRQK